MILANIFNAIATILHTLIFIYTWVVIIATLITWVRPDPNNPIVVILYKLTNPVFTRIKSKIPLVYSGIDFTPVFVVLVLQFIDMALVDSLSVYAQKLFQ
ncbi:YggT family protein [Helicobacter cappadocius]|uniref:YggT family protein n=1 Tax=Helicobacter cappadocius TaxID=3063998 RepID=A0AA90PSZ4_9HELI|nr:MULTISPECIES: YggT family protein [unclassified Helicobacter]MDO7252846.1 YggT family protein [Helicobacter sp. faydin-H75]MDP2538889.1 YggT family protein [Helicobacter sp. faydin-H76]